MFSPFQIIRQEFLRKLLAERDVWQKRIAEQDERIEELEGSMEFWKEQFQFTVKENHGWKEEYDKLQSENAALKDKVRELEDEIAQLNAGEGY